MRTRISIETLKENKNLTVEQFLNKIEEDDKQELQIEENIFEEIKTKYNNTYLKRIYNCSLFGRTLEVLHVTHISNKERTTEWNFIYQIEGTKIAFSKRDINLRQLDNDKKSIKNLTEYSFITEEEYNQYLNKYKELEKELQTLIK